MCWVGDLPPNRFCFPALGQVAGVCLWIQPELKGCVDLALGQLCASQIFSFPSDNLSVVSSLATTKCLFYSQTSWGFHRSFAIFWLPVWQMWGCKQGGLVTKAWAQSSLFLGSLVIFLPFLLCWVSRSLALCLFFQLSKWGFVFVLVVFYFNLNK